MESFSIGRQEIDPEEEKIALDTLERYTGSLAKDFQPYLLITNFSRYVEYFAKSRGVEVIEGAMFKVAHSPKERISILDFKIGSPSAALVVDLIANLPIRATLLLGMCGGLRRQYEVGNFFIPVAAIRGEGTSDFYFPQSVPSLASFMVQKATTNVLNRENTTYHIGITHTTNKRFWEFNAAFREHLMMTRPQAIEMECATLFTASYWHKLPLGALLLISDLPLEKKGVKTKASSEKVYENYTKTHIELGVKVIDELEKLIQEHPKGVFRGSRKRFA